METRIFSYHWSIKVMKWFFIFGGIAFIVNSIFLVVSLHQIANVFGGKPEVAFGLALFFLLVTPVSFLCILIIDHCPEIVVNNDGVTIKYLLNRICIHWSDMIKVENRKTPWLSKRKDKFVLTKNLPFHCRVRNIIFHGVFSPGFVINSSIMDFDVLNTNIQNRISTN